MIDALLDRYYTDDVTTFVDAVVSNVPADVADTAAAEARRYHALRVAEGITAGYEPYRLGKGKIGGGRFAKKGDIGIDILRDLLRGKGTARTAMHADFSKRHRADNDWGRGDLTPNNINRWATESFGPRPPGGEDANAWDAGRRELSSFLAALPRRSRVPEKPKADTTPGDGMVDWGAPKDAAHRLPNADEAAAAVDDVTPNVDIEGSLPGTQARVNKPEGSRVYIKGAGGKWEMEDPDAEDTDVILDKLPDGAEVIHTPDTPKTPAAPKAPVPADEMVDWGDRKPGAHDLQGGPDLDGIGATVPSNIVDTIESGNGTKESPFVTSNVEAAAFLLGHDQHVQLQSADQVATLLDQLQQRVKLLKDTGAKTPDFDLCKVTVPGTNLFCAESKGIPRIKMPQLGGKPLPGSPADSLPKNPKNGEVDLSEAFIKHLEGLGIAVTSRDVDASHLKASQIELNGTKIVGMMGALRDGTLPPGAIFVSRDNYVVDGHHRWAANVGAEYVDGEPMMMPTHTIDADIIDVLALANEFALSQGIPQAGVGDMQTGGGATSEMGGVAYPPDFPPDLVPNITGGDGTAKNPFKTADPTTAAHLLHGDQHVQLDAHPGQVTVVLDEVREMAKAIKEGGEKPPPFDLCKLTVPGTSLFCVESKGIPRVKMPQLSGTPIPGSPADSMEKDGEGRVNLTSEFPAWLAERGIDVTPGRRKVTEMKATQSELDGGKVGGIMQGWRDVAARGITRDPNAPEGVNQFITNDGEVIDGVQADRLAGLTDSIFVDRDGYVVDGHHRWAGAMGADIEHEGDLDIEMDTLEISDNVDIVEVIALANAFALEKGIPQAAVGQETGDAIKAPDAPPAPDAPAVPDAAAAPGAPVTNELAEPPAAPNAPAVVSNDPAAVDAARAADAAAYPETPTHQIATGETKTFTTADQFPLGRFGIEPGTEVQARYKDDDYGIVTVKKSDGTTQDVKVPWARLNLPATAEDTSGANGIQFTATPASSAAISDADRTLAAAYNPRSATLGELSSTNLLTRLAIADAMEKNPPDSGTAAFLRKVQAESQAALKAQGITHVTLYRGVAGQQDSPFPHDTTGLSSWTTNPDIAAEYAKGANGTLFKANVPVEQILSWDVLGALRSAGADQPGSEILVARDQSTAQRIGSGTFPFVANAPSAMVGQQAQFDPWDVFHPKADAPAGAMVPGASGDVPPAPAVDAPNPDAPVTNELFNRPPSADEVSAKAAWDAGKPDMAADDAKYRRDLDNMAAERGIDGAGMSNAELATALTKAKAADEKAASAPADGAPKKGLGGLFGKLRKGGGAAAPPTDGATSKPRAQQTATDLLGSDTSPEHIREILKSGDLTEAQREELKKLLPTDAVTAALAVAEATAARRRMTAAEEARAIAASIARDRVG